MLNQLLVELRNDQVEHINRACSELYIVIRKVFDTSVSKNRYGRHRNYQPWFTSQNEGGETHET